MSFQENSPFSGSECLPRGQGQGQSAGSVTPTTSTLTSNTNGSGGSGTLKKNTNENDPNLNSDPDLVDFDLDSDTDESESGSFVIPEVPDNVADFRDPKTESNRQDIKGRDKVEQIGAETKPTASKIDKGQDQSSVGQRSPSGQVQGQLEVKGQEVKKCPIKSNSPMPEKKREQKCTSCKQQDEFKNWDDEKKKKRLVETAVLFFITVLGLIFVLAHDQGIREAKSPATFILNGPPKDCLTIQRAILQGNYMYQLFYDDSIDPISGRGQGQGSKSASRQIIHPLKSLKKEVLCDFETNGGGWTIIQQRIPGAPHAQFYRPWRDYEQGFGFGLDFGHLFNGSYWLGLEAIRALTMDENGPVTLRIELTDWAGETRWAQYESFKVESADDSYRLRVSGYSGDAGDSLTYHNNQQFSTLDRINDKTFDQEQGPCAKTRHSGWWFDWCTMSNLNGLHWDGQYSNIYETVSKGDGITWYAWKGPNYSLKSVTMKIRRANFNR